MAVVAGGAVELTPDEQEAKIAQCHEIEDTIKAGLRVGREAMWHTAKSLYEFDQESGWKVLGVETLGEWLADPEINMSRATYYRLTRAFRVLVIERHVPAQTIASLDVSKVDIVLPAIESGKVPMDDALGDAESLGSNDLREKYLGRKPRARQDVVNGKATPIPTPDAPAGQAGTVAPSVEPVRASSLSSNDARVEAGLPPVKHPSKKEYDAMVARAKKRRRNFVQYAQWVGRWSLMGGDGSDRAHWNVLPPPEPQSDPPAGETSTVASGNGTGPENALSESDATLDQALEDWRALRITLLDAVASGTQNPRVDGRLIRAGVQGVELIVADWQVRHAS